MASMPRVPYFLDPAFPQLGVNRVASNTVLRDSLKFFTASNVEGHSPCVLNFCHYLLLPERRALTPCFSLDSYKHPVDATEEVERGSAVAHLYGHKIVVAMLGEPLLDCCFNFF